MSMIRYESIVLRCRGNDHDTVTVPYTLAIAHSGFLRKVFQDRERRHENHNVVDIDAPPWFVWSPQTLNSIAQWMRNDADGNSTFDYDNDKVVEIAKAADYLDMAGLIAACAEALSPQLREHPRNWKPEFAGLLRDYERVRGAIVDAVDMSQLSVDRLQELQQGFQDIGGNVGTHPILRRIDAINLQNPGWDIARLMPHLRWLQVLTIRIEERSRCCHEQWDMQWACIYSYQLNWNAVQSIIQESLPSTVHTLSIYEKHFCALDECKYRADSSQCRCSCQIRLFIDLADKTHIRDFTHWNECRYLACPNQLVGIRSIPTQLQHLCLHGVSRNVEFPISLTSLTLRRGNNFAANLSNLVHLKYLQIEICWQDDHSDCILHSSLPPHISKLHLSGDLCTCIGGKAFLHLTIRELHLEGITSMALGAAQQMRLFILKISKDLESLIVVDNHCFLYYIFFNNSSVIFPRITTLSLTFANPHYHDIPLDLLYPSLCKLRIILTTPMAIISFAGTSKVKELEVEIGSNVSLHLSTAFQTAEYLSLVIRNSYVDWIGLPKNVTTLEIDLDLGSSSGLRKDLTTCAIDLDLGSSYFGESMFSNYFDDGRFPQYFKNLTRLVIKQTDTAMRILKNNVSTIQSVEIAQSLTCMLYFKRGIMLLVPRHVKIPIPCVKSNNPTKDLKCVFQSLDYTRCKLENITIYTVQEE